MFHIQDSANGMKPLWPSLQVLRQRRSIGAEPEAVRRERTNPGLHASSIAG